MFITVDRQSIEGQHGIIVDADGVIDQAFFELAIRIVEVNGVDCIVDQNDQTICEHEATSFDVLSGNS